MDRRFEDVETDSTVDNTLEQMDTSDPEIQFRALARGMDAGQLLVGDVGPVAMGPRTDADACQAADSNTLGHLAARLTPRDDLAATPPSAAAEANGVWHGMAHSTPYPAEVMHYGPHHAASRATVVDQSAVVGSELGCFVGPSSSRPGVERVVTSNWGDTTPTTIGCPHKHNGHCHFHICDMFNCRWASTIGVPWWPTSGGIDGYPSCASVWHATSRRTAGTFSWGASWSKRDPSSVGRERAGHLGRGFYPQYAPARVRRISQC